MQRRYPNSHWVHITDLNMPWKWYSDGTFPMTLSSLRLLTHVPISLVKKQCKRRRIWRQWLQWKVLKERRMYQFQRLLHSTSLPWLFLELKLDCLQLIFGDISSVLNSNLVSVLSNILDLSKLVYWTMHSTNSQNTYLYFSPLSTQNRPSTPK